MYEINIKEEDINQAIRKLYLEMNKLIRTRDKKYPIGIYFCNRRMMYRARYSTYTIGFYNTLEEAVKSREEYIRDNL